MNQTRCRHAKGQGYFYIVKVGLVRRLEIYSVLHRLGQTYPDVKCVLQYTGILIVLLEHCILSANVVNKL